MQQPLSRSRQIGLTILCVVVVLRFLSLAAMPLVDPSESRYALIAHLMNASGHYLVPEVVDHDGVQIPFWAKPPLFFWANALSFHLLGQSELSARLPSFLSMILVLGFVFATARRLFGEQTAWVASLILASSGVFFIYGGLCQIDMLLTASITGVLCAALLWKTERRYRAALSLLAGVALALGFLAKGPVAVALVALAVVTPTVWRLARLGGRVRRSSRSGNPIRTIFRRIQHFHRIGSSSTFPIVRITLLAAALVTPWFFFAEKQSPGLTRYFLLQENLLRFVAKDYGDRYGSPHHYPFGMIWIFLLVAVMPWGFVLVIRTREISRLFRQVRLRKDELFLLSWGIAPALLFTPARNILPSYVLPGLPGLALFAAVTLQRNEAIAALAVSLFRTMRYCFLALAIGAVFLGSAYVGTVTLDFHSDALLETNLALVALVYFVLRAVTIKSLNENGGSAVLCAGLTLFILQTTAGVVTAEQVPASTYARYLTERFPPQKYELNFPFGIPYSAHLYLSHELESDPIELLDPLEEETELVIVPAGKGNRFAEMADTHSVHYDLIADMGEWKGFRRRMPPLLTLETLRPPLVDINTD